MFNKSFIPKITLPTRFSSQSASLIDNIYCKLSDKTLDTTSGIIFTGISDHLPYFLCVRNVSSQQAAPPKYVKCRINKPEAIRKFIQELHANDIYDRLNHELETNPNDNYDKLIETITIIKNKHLPYRFVKFNKHKHKGSRWITYDIINSLKSRDKKLYQLKQLERGSPEYLALKQNISVFNSIIKKDI